MACLKRDCGETYKTHSGILESQAVFTESQKKIKTATVQQ